MDLGLNDRVFVVTAASSGLGRATADQLVAEGARVVLVARRTEVLEQGVADLGADHAVALTADMADQETAERACQLALDTWGRLDGAMISVGGPPQGSVLEITEEQWRTAYDSVFLAALRTFHAVRKHVTTEELAVAFVLSTTAKSPITSLGISNGLRPGLAMLIKDLADQLGPEGTRVLGLMPGSVETERLAALNGSGPEGEERRRATEASIPLRRFGRPEEFGRVAAFALSPAASYVTGTVIPVEGGALRAL